MTDSFKQHLKPIGVKTNERRLKTNSGVSLGMHRCLESGLNEERREGLGCVCGGVEGRRAVREGGWRGVCVCVRSCSGIGLGGSVL